MSESASGSGRPRRAPAKKAPAKKAPAKKAPAKKAPAKKAPAKKAPAKKAPAKKAPAKKAPAKKAPPSGQERGASTPRPSLFARVLAGVQRLAQGPEGLEDLARRAGEAGASRSGPFAGVLDDFDALVRLVIAYARGDYRDISPDRLAVVVAGLLYVASPVDLIPDLLFGVGFLDDAAVIGQTIKSVHAELETFRAWEAVQAEKA